MNQRDRKLFISYLPNLCSYERIVLDESPISIRQFMQNVSKTFVELFNRPYYVSKSTIALVLANFSRCKRYLSEHADTGVIFFQEDAYPALLREIYDPPFRLFYRGSPQVSNNRLMSIVGTRYASASALEAAFRSGTEVSSAGCVPVSGCSNTIEQYIHMGAVAVKRPSLVVLEDMHQTYHRIIDLVLDNDGCLFSEYLFDGTCDAEQVSSKHRIIAGLSDSIMLIQSPKQSPALEAIRYSLDEGRDVYVHRTGTTGIQSAGCRFLASEGARVVFSMNQIIDQVYWQSVRCPL